MMQNEVNEIWRLYQIGVDYNVEINHYDVVDRNERFAYGDQWQGVKSKGLPTPSFNIFKRVINYMIGYLVSSPIKATVKFMGQEYGLEETDEAESIEALIKQVGHIFDYKWEFNKIDNLLGDMLHEGAISGDMCLHTYWDKDIDTGQEKVGNSKIMGDFVTELIDSVNVMLGNPNDRRINFMGRPHQPYVLVIGRSPVTELKEECDIEEERDKITSDMDYEYTAGDRGKIELNEHGNEGKATWVIKYWHDKKSNKIMWSKVTRQAYVRKNVVSKNEIYPIAFANWDMRKNSYHGSALITNYIPNQIFVNKMLALAMVHYMSLATPKVLYDKTKIPSWSNQVGGAIGVNGLGQGSIKDVATMFTGADMPQGFVNLVEYTVSLTLQAMGANEALLGDVKPENTSAIIQVTEQAAVPLLNQRKSLYNIVEQMTLIWFDFVKNYYGDVERTIVYTDNEGNEQSMKFSASKLKDSVVMPKIDVGPSTWWSETDSVKTLDALFQAGIIDVIQYLKRLPKGHIPMLEDLIAELQNVAKKTGGMDIESMKAFVQTLPPEQQQQLSQLSNEELIQTVSQMMANQPI